MIRDKGEGNLRGASKLYEEGYRTALFINSGMLDTKTSPRIPGILDRHWVILRSKVQIPAEK